MSIKREAKPVTPSSAEVAFDSHPLRPAFQAIKDSVPAADYDHASGRAWVELHRKRRRRYAIR